MGGRPRSAIPALATQLRRRIERWRRQRTKRSPMPQDLWASAVSLARRHGVYPIARALGIDYGALKKRVAPCRQGGEKAAKISTEFIELAPGPLLGHTGPSGMVVELSEADGSKLVVRLPDGAELDVGSLAEAFWRRRG